LSQDTVFYTGESEREYAETVANLNSLQASQEKRERLEDEAKHITPSFTGPLALALLVVSCGPLLAASFTKLTKCLLLQAKAERRRREEAAATSERLANIGRHGLDPNISISEYERAMAELRKKVAE